MFIIKAMTGHKICKLLVIALLLLHLVGISDNPVVAQTKNEAASSQSALAISPAIIEQVLTPGKPVAFTVQVNNVTNFPLPVKGYVRDFTIQSAELEKTERARLDASQWFIIEEPDFILQPNQVRTVKGTIHTPADAPPGGHYATIYFQPLVPIEALSPTMAYVNAKVGVLAFLAVKGDIEQEAVLSRSLQTASLIRHGPIDFTFSIRNTGNVHLMPTGKLTIYDGRGRKVETLDTSIGIILPSTTKKYTMQWKSPPPIGKYRAELALSYGTEHIQMQKTSANFWVVPWIEILTTAVLLLLTVLFVRKTRRRWRRTWRALHD